MHNGARVIEAIPWRCLRVFEPAVAASVRVPSVRDPTQLRPHVQAMSTG